MNRYRTFLPVVILLVALDLVTKYWLSTILALGGRPLLVIPKFFQLTLVHNTGAAFGIGHRWSLPFFIIVSLIALGVIAYLFHKLGPSERLSMWALTFIAAGAVGNLVDRLRFGYVVDFFDVYVGRHHWPAFNVADSVITVGAILFGIDLLRSKKKGG